MIQYKMDVLAALKEKGYTTYKIRKDHLLPECAVVNLRKNKLIGLSSLDKVCDLLNCDVGDIIYHEKDAEEKG